MTKSVIASSASAGGRPARDEKLQWHRRPRRCPPQSGGVFSTGRDAGATESFLPSISDATQNVRRSELLRLKAKNDAGKGP
jgi:hypothetical protein